jgi:hypothetical protein
MYAHVKVKYYKMCIFVMYMLKKQIILYAWHRYSVCGAFQLRGKKILHLHDNCADFFFYLSV